MQPRVTVKRGDEVVVHIICKGGISDGDLSVMLEDVEQDLRWNVMKMTETHYSRPTEGECHNGIQSNF